MRKRWFCVLAVVMSGCIPYAFPSIVATPSVNVSDCKDEIHAFRVDVSSKSGAPCYGNEIYSLSEISLRSGRVPVQIQAGMDTGVIIIAVALNYHFHYHNGIEIRLYRPGYQVVQFKSWQAGRTPDWRAAADVADREKAIDALLAPSGTVDWCSPRFVVDTKETRWTLPLGVRDGSQSEGHRNVLQFVAQEYRRLAGLIELANADEIRNRLLDKAQQVQARAEK